MRRRADRGGVFGSVKQTKQGRKRTMGKKLYLPIRGSGRCGKVLPESWDLPRRKKVGVVGFYAGLEHQLGTAMAMTTATAGRRVGEAPTQLTPGIGRGG